MRFQEPQSGPLLNPSASFQSNYFNSDQLLPSESFTDQNISDIRSNLPTYALPTDWPSTDTRQPLDDNAPIQDHLSGSGALLVAQMSSTRHGQPAIYTTVNEQGRILVPRNDVNTFNAGLLPISHFSHGLRAQISNRKKPLPPLPSLGRPETESRAAKHSLTTPMDLNTG